MTTDKAPATRRNCRDTADAVTVDADARRHLITACAFFRADRYREVEPATVREADYAAAARDVDAVIGRKPAS